MDERQRLIVMAVKSLELLAGQFAMETRRPISVTYTVDPMGVYELNVKYVKLGSDDEDGTRGSSC